MIDNGQGIARFTRNGVIIKANTIILFKELKEGDRFHMLTDKKKQVFEITEERSLTYKGDNEKFGRLPNTALKNKQVMFLRNSIKSNFSI